ncbi:hypothetical protein MPRM_25110 [Mycobacterium parmense]|uniref:Uncharacterized protein n=2 Tax=Mycobacterium parmense TaxID=185642 RepID=A0A7I7YTZ0_9MYCO|nr:hypothetical protein AWC20_07850 [Mycobacterium parmense]BBZ45230.1 hypothetical protein MPRM_25110 [Mycobacterium parmense]
MSEKSAEPWASWTPCADDEGTEALTRLAARLPAFFADSTLVSCRWSALSFYSDHRLMELQFFREHGMARAYALHGLHDTEWLSGESNSIHEVNEAESLELTESTVADYVRFFFYFLRADDGAFVLIESADEVHAPADVEERDEGGDDTLSLKAARATARPLSARGLDDTGRWLLDAAVTYGGHLFTCSLAVESDGVVEMMDDEPIGALGGLRVPQAPSLELEADGVPPSEEVRVDAPGGRGAGDGLPRDRQVTEAVVTVLLEDAIRELNNDTRAGNILLRRFNLETQAGKPIKQLTHLIESNAIVIIESDIPFVEDVVAQLVASSETTERAARCSAINGDDLRCEITVNEYTRLYLLSFHAYRGLFDAERAAHDLAFSEAPVLIGCNQAGEVPEPLRRIADCTVTFPRIDRRRFARIFEGVFDCKPAPGWEAGGADWTQFLVPGDFHLARRLALGPGDALTVLKDRVEARLVQLTPDDDVTMADLHGMGEARQIAEDLIGDIRAAEAGRIPWSAVDKGLLLTGAPGTGKTTLAKAIAKECGIKFVIASAAAWQSAGALDVHLRAMRTCFAEARRYAPAILFIDELDSIGSRERLEGSAEQYQTEVINALLEEIQGIESTGSVIVIGATNYLEKVDPALRRAGRLDQVVEIPLPNIKSLASIFDHYLSRYQKSGGELGVDIDTKALADLAFGCTGADVEFFVRGAARRARRENRPVAQNDLVAEVTRRPRRPENAPQLAAAERHRIAVHEAGHTVARLISSTRGEDLTFVSIIPRLDGSLGFTAAVPDNTRVMTRRTMLEELETVLAGRASEELAFGADDIGAGAGGMSSGCDLAVATRFATLIVCQSGFGGDGFLRWTTVPTPTQEGKIDDVIRSAYESILGRLQGCRPLLNRVVAALEEKQELTGNELRRLAKSIGNGAAPTG